MTLVRSSLVCLLGAAPVLASAGASVQAVQPPVTPGLYELQIRLELPHLERYAATRTETVCIGSDAHLATRLPVLTGNAVFRSCPATNRQWVGTSLSYDIVCPGRAPARAAAVYTFTGSAFRGRISITLGAKNMTVTEIQRGRRIGDCPSPLNSARQVGPR